MLLPVTSLGRLTGGLYSHEYSSGHKGGVPLPRPITNGVAFQHRPPVVERTRLSVLVSPPGERTWNAGFQAASFAGFPAEPPARSGIVLIPVSYTHLRAHETRHDL